MMILTGLQRSRTRRRLHIHTYSGLSTKLFKTFPNRTCQLPVVVVSDISSGPLAAREWSLDVNAITNLSFLP